MNSAASTFWDEVVFAVLIGLAVIGALVFRPVFVGIQ